MGEFLKACKEDNNIYKLIKLGQNVFNKHILCLDRDGVTLWCNDYTKKDFKQNIIGKTAYDIFSKESADECKKDNSEIIKSKTTIYANKTFTLPNGKEKNVFIIKTPRLLADGEVAGIFSSAFNVKQFEDKVVNNNYNDKSSRDALLIYKLQSLCFDVQPLLKEILADTYDDDKYLCLQQFTKNLLSSCQQVADNFGKTTTNINHVPVRSRRINLSNLVKETIIQESIDIKSRNLKFIYTATDQELEIDTNDFLKIKKITQLIIRNLLKSASKLLAKEVVCKVEFIFEGNFNVLMIFEAEPALFQTWFLKEQSIQYKLGLMREFSNDKNYRLGLSLIKYLIKELNGNIELFELYKTTKMLIEFPL